MQRPLLWQPCDRWRNIVITFIDPVLGQIGGSDHNLISCQGLVATASQILFSHESREFSPSRCRDARTWASRFKNCTGSAPVFSYRPSPLHKLSMPVAGNHHLWLSSARGLENRTPATPGLLNIPHEMNILRRGSPRLLWYRTCTWLHARSGTSQCRTSQCRPNLLLS
jgi:hypothetical protein